MFSLDQVGIGPPSSKARDFLHTSNHLFLPVAGVPGALRDVRQAVLDTRADVGEAVADGTADAARQAVYRLAEAAGGASDDAADCVADA